MSTSALPWDLILATKDGRRVLIRESSTLDYCTKAASTIAPTHPDVIAEGADAVLECVLRVSKPAAAPVPVPPPPASSTPWVMTRSTMVQPAAVRPPRGVPYIDPLSRLSITRVSDKTDPVGTFARIDYSRRQAFNADNSRIIAAALDGWWHLYNAKTNTHYKKLPSLSGDAEPQWHPTNPDVLYFMPSKGVGMKLYEMNVVTGAVTTKADFGARLKAKWPTAMACWTGSEGSPSADGRYWCFMIDGTGWASVGIICWDMETDSIVGSMSTNGNRPDHVSMSPSGRWCVTSHANTTGTVAWSRDLKTSRKLLGASQHSDVALTSDLHDAYIAIDYGDNEGSVFMFDIDANVRTNLFATYIAGNATAYHFSGKAFKAPGWAVVSAQAEDPAKPQAWMHRKVFLVELKANPRILNVAWHQSAPATNGDWYYHAPVATISADGKKLAFNSTFGSRADADLSFCQVDLPPLP